MTGSLCFFTGDDRIHFSALDLMRYVLCCKWLRSCCDSAVCWCLCSQCCCCFGEETNQFVMPIVSSCMRVCRPFRTLGQMSGIMPRSLEISNIIVGDLPFAGSVGDFYLSVEVATNPPMVTSLAEERCPKAVQFPETLTIRIRSSPLEQPVRFVVKELKIMGSREICEAYLSAAQILDWTDDEVPAKRVAMSPVADEERLLIESPPWIYCQFSLPQDERELENLNEYIPWDFKESRSSYKVRTIDRSKAAGRKDGLYTDATVAHFKEKYVLIDHMGQPVEEPADDQVEAQLARRLHKKICLSCAVAMLLVLVALYCLFRTVVWCCQSNFRWITVAKLQNQTVPISVATLRVTASQCRQKLVGTGILPGAHPCRPSAPAILKTCESCPVCPSLYCDQCDDALRQPRPKALSMIINQVTGWQHVGIPCPLGVCQWSSVLPVLDMMVILTSFLLLLGVVSLHSFWEGRIRQEKLDREKNNIAKFRQYKDFSKQSACKTCKGSGLAWKILAWERPCSECNGSGHSLYHAISS